MNKTVYRYALPVLALLYASVVTGADSDKDSKAEATEAKPKTEATETKPEAQATIPPGPASRGWECRWCLQDEGMTGDVQAGAIYVDETAARFGAYNGLDKEGGYLDLSGNLRYRGTDASYLDLRATDLGLDSRAIEVEGGRQGKYDFSLGYDQLPHNISNETVTPFIENGSSLSLPQNWVPADGVDNMPTLSQSLRPVDLETRRDTFKAGATYYPARDWELRANYKQQEKSGHQSLGATFGFGQTMLLPAPVDYETNEVDLALAYAGKGWQSELGYSGSFFDNAHSALFWQNPFAHLNDPTETGYGQMALPPDNQSHQMRWNLGYNFSPQTRLTAYLARGKLSQDETLLPYTVNPLLSGLTTTPARFNGEVDTSKAKVALSSRPMPKLRVNAEYTYNDRDNSSSSNSYRYIITDIALGKVDQTNLPYSFTQHLARLNAGYRLPWRSDISGGFDYDRMERTHQEVDATTDNTAWARFKTKPLDNVDVRLDYSYSHRTNPGYHTVAEIYPPQNPLLRLFNLAERDRQKAGLNLTYAINEQWNLSYSGDYWWDNYADTAVGLQEDENLNHTLQASYVPSDKLTMYAYYTWNQLKSQQAGSAAYADADWFALSRYTGQTTGVGLTWAINKKWDMGMDMLYSDFAGTQNFRDGLSYPELHTRLWSTKLYANYKLQENLSLRFAYVYETYDEDNWAYDNVTAQSLPNVLSLGQTSDNYGVNMFLTSLRYRF